MRIAFDGKYAEDDLAGVGKYIENLITGLKNRGVDCVLFYSKKPKVAVGGCEKVVLVSSNTYYYEQVLLPKTLREKNIDIYHAPGNTGISPFSPVPTVLTVHDVIPLEIGEYFKSSSFPLVSKGSYLLRLTSSCFLAKQIITVTNFVKRQLIQKLGVKRNKITVINSGVSVINKQISLPFNLKRKGYILNHGGIDMRKNLERLLIAFKKVGNLFPDQKLVITGNNSYLRPKLQEKAKSLGLVNKIIFSGYVNESILWTLIRNSSCVCYPSLAEGFGLPILEAFAGGVPVISSKRSSTLEISGNAALLINPIDTNEIYSAIVMVLENEEFSRSLVTKGLIRVKKFQWDKAVEETLKIYKKALI